MLNLILSILNGLFTLFVVIILSTGSEVALVWTAFFMIFMINAGGFFYHYTNG